MTKNADFDKYRYSEHVTGFDAHRSFPLSDGSSFGENVVYAAAMSSSVHIHIKYLHSW